MRCGPYCLSIRRLRAITRTVLPGAVGSGQLFEIAIEIGIESQATRYDFDSDFDFDIDDHDSSV
jgi:hypothetical protein